MVTRTLLFVGVLTCLLPGCTGTDPAPPAPWQPAAGPVPAQDFLGAIADTQHKLDAAQSNAFLRQEALAAQAQACRAAVGRKVRWPAQVQRVEEGKPATAVVHLKPYTPFATETGPANALPRLFQVTLQPAENAGRDRETGIPGFTVKAVDWVRGLRRDDPLLIEAVVTQVAVAELPAVQTAEGWVARPASGILVALDKYHLRAR